MDPKLSNEEVTGWKLMLQNKIAVLEWKVSELKVLPWKDENHMVLMAQWRIQLEGKWQEPKNSNLSLKHLNLKKENDKQGTLWYKIL